MIDDAISITVAVPLIQVVLTGVFGAQQVDLVVHCRYSWFGFVQERRSEKSLEALNKLVPLDFPIIVMLSGQSMFRTLTQTI